MTDITNIAQLAELLHTICCHMNHTDACSWYYEKEDDATHIRYKACVEKLIEQFGFETTRDMIVKIRKIQFGERVEDI